MFKMTDREHQESLEKQYEHQDKPTLTQDSLELQYPQLLLEASLHSLLTHSFSSSPSASTVVNMPHSEPSLHDSFIHVDENDTDDDAHSEVTDVSLFSGSLRDGAQTPTEDREPSDIENEGDTEDVYEAQEQESDQEIQDNYTIVHRSSSVSDSPLSTSLAGSADTLTLRPSAEMAKRQRDTEWLRSLTPFHDLRSEAEMVASKFRQDIGRRPFRVLCCVSPAVSTDTKDEILSKVGSVLVGSNTFSKTISPYYHVVPIEFGPGAKPETADLIPIPVQMVVHECHLPTSAGAEGSFNLSLVENANISTDHVDRIEIEDADGNWHQPDLLLILISNSDSQDFKQYLNAFLARAKAHLVPMIVKQEQDMNDCPSYIDVERLIAMDFESMSSYLRSIIEASVLASESTMNNIHEKLQRTYSSRWIPNWLSKKPFARNTERNIREVQPALLQIPTESNDTSDDSTSQSMHYSDRASSFPLRNYVSSSTAASICGIFALSTLLAFVLRLTSEPGAALAINGSLKSTTCFATSASSSAIVTTSVISAQHADPDHASGLEQIVQMLAPVKKSDTDVIVLEEKNVQHIRPYGGRLRRQSIIETCPAGKKVVFGSKGNDLVVPQDFLSSNGSLLPVTVSITKNGNQVNFASVSTKTGFDIQLDEDDFHGVIDVLLRPSTSDSRLCMQVDLRDSLLETMAIMSKKRLPATNLKGKTNKLMLSLVHVRMPNWSDRGLFGRLKSVTVKPFYAVEDSLEKSLIRQVRACIENQQECITQRLQGYRDALASRRNLVTQRARNIVDSSFDRAASSMGTLYKAVPGIPKLFKNQHDKLIQTAARSQGRARRLVDRSRTKKHQR